MKNSFDKKFNIIALLSVISIISLIIFPVTREFKGSVIPDYDDFGSGLSEVMEYITENNPNIFKSVGRLSVIFASVFYIILIVSSLCKDKTLNIISSLLGIFSMGWCLYKFIDLNDIDAVFDFEDCGITIGFWIPFVIFIICFVISLTIDKTHKKNN